MPIPNLSKLVPAFAVAHQIISIRIEVLAAESPGRSARDRLDAEQSGGTLARLVGILGGIVVRYSGIGNRGAEYAADELGHVKLEG